MRLRRSRYLQRKAKDLSNSRNFSFLLSPCTGGALWPPRIEEAPNDAQEGVATEGRPYGVFYEAQASRPDVLLIEEPLRWRQQQPARGTDPSLRPTYPEL